ncbi:hypothetical protein TNCT_207801 [Trichonephila clavata]|uniref:Uncharacterized protein n=1 Tax=Trichonephila clavata TaxID=2740835 RepID=A0A8X6FHC2_TRICU|nr:hypothetical protein TNCT_207801 [Trichonephila clavata]
MGNYHVVFSNFIIEVSRVNIFENKRQRLNSSSPQNGPPECQAPAAKERRNNTRSRPDEKIIKPLTVFRGKNDIDEFLTKLLDEEKSIMGTLRYVKPMIFSPADEENFNPPHNAASVKILSMELP